jgi:hypothetical protein
MSQLINVVVPVYDGVTPLDFTGPRQFRVQGLLQTLADAKNASRACASYAAWPEW